MRHAPHQDECRTVADSLRWGGGVPHFLRGASGVTLTLSNVFGWPCVAELRQDLPYYG